MPNLLEALTPTHCAVVEACAGSGKTWLLVSRMLRLLLAGAEPSELLAITFTRKAAAEMQARLDAWLADLALLPEPQALAFLVERGLTPAAAHAALPAARGLLEKVLAAPPMMTTFHGWFFHLIARAPLPLRLPGEVIEDAALLREEAWYALAEHLGRHRGSPEEAAFAELACEFSLTSLRHLLEALLARRGEWWAAGLEQADPVAATVTALEARLGVHESDDPAAQLMADPDFKADLAAFRPLLARNGEKLKSEAQRLEQLDQAHTVADLAAVFLTQKGELRACKLTDTLSKRLGDAAPTFVLLHDRLGERLQRALQQVAEQRALRLNRLALTVGQAYLDVYQRLKSERGGLDFADAEIEAARLLDDLEAASAILAKLDTRWKHLLLDEFQDTNPLQWRILRAWLDAYGSDGERPTVFLVGDPKQSIYRFRRAEPRLFQVACRWLQTHYQARHYPLDETRRCAPRVVAWINAVFSGRDDYPLFNPHHAHQTDLPGHCELHIEEHTAAATPAIAFRDPLTQPPVTLPHKRETEAAWVASRIQEIVGGVQLAHGRPAGYGDITVLYSTRRDLDIFEAAFKRAGIPYIGDRRGGLLDSLEVADCLALLGVLVSPRNDLALAHALKSPLFGLADHDLQRLAGRAKAWDDVAASPLPAAAKGASWWQRLHHWAEAADAPAHIVRAARLLDDWHGSAGHLPAHDLLDRIYHQGEVLERYAAAVPAHLVAGVSANLEGLLGLSLNLAGGRYPSLPRFLDTLRQLRDKAGADAPDEPPANAGDAVRMLTIHAAKGLEAPVVFLIKADQGEAREDASGVILDWPPTADRPAHFSIYGPKAWRGPGRDDLFAQEAALAAREHLNQLYVAMTRARQMLIVSGVQEAGKAPAHWLGLLQGAWAKAAFDGLSEVLPPPLGEGRGEGAAADSAPQADQAPFPLPQEERGEIPRIGEFRAPAGAAADFGVAVHACLEHGETGGGEHDAAVLAAARRILTIPELAAAFDPARHLCAWNEMEFLGPDGNSFRIDRLVEFTEEIWVLDYKTGGLNEPDLARRAEAHREQLAGYTAAARELFPGKRVKAVLAFADGKAAWL